MQCFAVIQQAGNIFLPAAVKIKLAYNSGTGDRIKFKFSLHVHRDMINIKVTRRSNALGGKTSKLRAHCAQDIRCSAKNKKNNLR